MIDYFRFNFAIKGLLFSQIVFYVIVKFKFIIMSVINHVEILKHSGQNFIKYILLCIEHNHEQHI